MLARTGGKIFPPVFLFSKRNRIFNCPMLIRSITIKPVANGYRPLELLTGRGKVECRFYPASGAHSAAVLVGGAGGGWDTPACDLYPHLSDDLASSGISVLRVRYRQPNNLEESAFDVLAGLSYLETEGVSAAALIGHSFGGAVAIQAAAVSPMVCTVIGLATQSFGADPVAELAPRCSVLLIHGSADPVLPPYCSEWAYFLAGDPKRLVVYQEAGHDLEEVAPELHDLIKSWLAEHLPIA